MNKKTKIINFAKPVLFVLFLVCTLVILPSAAKYLGFAVCYSVSGDGQGVESDIVHTEKAQRTVYPYKTVSEIPLLDGYIVKVLDGKIGVFDKHMSPLYRINARVESLPENDRQAVVLGIEFSGKSPLCEFVSHMES